MSSLTRSTTFFSFSGSPHNSFIGESGKYAYATGYQNDTMQVWDQVGHTKVRDIGPFGSGIRPFSVTRDEKYVVVNLTDAGRIENSLPSAVGFGIGEVETGEVVGEFLHDVPMERIAMGSADSYGGDGNMPIQIVTGPGFEMAKTEITVGGYDACFNAGSCQNPRSNASYSTCTWSRGEPEQ